MSDEDATQRALAMALRLLAAREHGRVELERKLKRRFPAEVVEPLLERLSREGLQSDDRFVEGYLRSRMEKGFGPLRIRAELKARGVDEARVRLALEAVEEEWARRLRQVVERKFGTAPPQDRKELARRARFLAGRGFPESMIRDHLFS